MYPIAITLAGPDASEVAMPDWPVSISEGEANLGEFTSYLV
jgi:hypothetical protein